MTRLGALQQFVMFALVGCAAAVAHYGVLIGLCEGLGAPPVPASGAGFIVGGVVSYILNYRYVFRSDEAHGPTATKFLMVATTGLGINSAIMWALTHGWTLHYLLAQVMATVTVMSWSFAANRYWTFGTASSE